MVNKTESATSERTKFSIVKVAATIKYSQIFWNKIYVGSIKKGLISKGPI